MEENKVVTGGSPTRETLGGFMTAEGFVLASIVNQFFRNFFN